MNTRFLVIMIIFGLSFPLFASDHIDGVATIEDGQADLTDLYAFPTPNKDNHLTIILNMYPGVSTSGHFSKKVSYDILIRMLEVNQPPKSSGFQVFEMDALKIKCQFNDPLHHSQSKLLEEDRKDVNCALYKENQELSYLSGDVNKTIENSHFRLFTGSRTDPFFLSVDQFSSVTERKGFVPSPEKSKANVMNLVNIMTIALEVDLNSIGINHPLLGVAAESYTTNQKTRINIDRVGRPEITNLSLHDITHKPPFSPGKNPLKRSYNIISSFMSSSILNSPYKLRLIDNISAYDMLDNKKDWSDENLDFLSEILVNDFLILDLSKNGSENTNQYFAIEEAMLLGRENQSCGGRSLTNDIMAKLYGLYIDGPDANLLNFETGASFPYQDNPSRVLSEQFPYLAPAGKTPFSKKAALHIFHSLQE